eukprot:2533453-Prymnesium_polylepis.1
MREAPSPFRRKRVTGWHSWASRMSARVGFERRWGVPAASMSSFEGGRAAAAVGAGLPKGSVPLPGRSRVSSG